MEEHLHPTTVTAAMRILVVLLSNPTILTKFKEGLSGGGWLDQTDSVLTNKIGTVLGNEFLSVCFSSSCVLYQLAPGPSSNAISFRGLRGSCTGF